MATLDQKQEAKVDGTSKNRKVDAKPLKDKGVSADGKLIIPAGSQGSGMVKGRPTTPREIDSVAKVRAGLGVTRAIFARMTGVSERTLASWEAGNAPPAAGMRRVIEMSRLGEALAEVMKREYIPTWLTTPCEALGGLKPVETLERGEADRLWRVVLLLGSGMPV